MSVADEIRSKGKRMTVRRRLALEALQRARPHTTAEEIARQVRSRRPQIDPSTVYRNLEALEDLGYVTHTHLDDRVTRWHRADVERHGHLVCRRCGSEQEIPLRTLEPLGRRLRTEQGFRADVERHAPLVCRRCGSEQEIPLRTLEPLGRRLRTEQGFRADLAHSAIVGICRECAP